MPTEKTTLANLRRPERQRLSNLKLPPLAPTASTSSTTHIPCAALPWQAECPPYPSAGYPHDAAREEWRNAHAAIAEAEYGLDPQRIATTVAALHKYDQACADGRGRKPSGDLRHPVPRDYIETTTAAWRARYEARRDRALATIRAIENGDVVGVRFSFTSQQRTTSSYDAEGRLVHDCNAEAGAALDELFDRPQLILRGEDEEAKRRSAETRRLLKEEMARIENMDDAQVSEYLRDCGVTPEPPVLYRGWRNTPPPCATAIRERRSRRKRRWLRRQRPGPPPDVLPRKPTP